MVRKTTRQIDIDINTRCQRVYPTNAYKGTLDELVTIGIRLNKNQAIHLARILLIAAQDWENIDLTAYRNRMRSTDNTFQITVTSSDEPDDAIIESQV